jgi:hypothetical protein
MNAARPLACALLALSCRLAAEDVVVFGKGDSRVLGPAAQAAPRDPESAAFLAAAQAGLRGAAPYDASFALINPPAWGRVVSADSAGKLRIRRSFPHGFAFRVGLEHLEPLHSYVLCINGRPGRPGNGLLPESVPGHESEKYYDFYTLRTDARGGYDAAVALLLRPGPYNVHFYVKDTSDFKIVLYGLEYFDFEAK